MLNLRALGKPNMPFGPLPFGSYPASAANGNFVGPGTEATAEKRMTSR
jgi:hypothetical protein